ncbi:MAG: lipase family protein, partial [Clostridia bacterium]|nr:lipase family protein [Clostridia bacterium]
MTAGSRVGIFTDWEATATNYPVETTYNDISHFFSDKNNLAITGEDGLIYYIEAPNVEEPSVSDKYVVDGIEYELQNGTFTYNSDLSGNLEAKYFYSDGYFAESPTVYNEHLATTSVNMTLASATSDLGERLYTEEAASENIRKFMSDIGYTDMQIDYKKPAYYGDNANPLSTIGYIISNKKVNLNGSEHTIVSMTVRSAEYADEWASNVTLGDGIGEAEGFSDAATQVMTAIEKYLVDKNIDTSTVKFWLTGYSRGGATANIVSKRLTDIYGGEKVYGYTFEAPRGGVKSEIKLGETYLNIHNIIYTAYLVTYVGPEEMGFVRYGHDVYVP